MKHISIIMLCLVLVGVFAISIDADGGLFKRQKCCPNKLNNPQPDETPFPFDEIPPVCPTPGLDAEYCEGLERRIATLEDAAGNYEREEIDIIKLAELVAKRLPPVIMQIQHPNGDIFSQSKPLGEPIRLRLVPQ